MEYDDFFEGALEEFRANIRYIGAFVEGDLPKNQRIIIEELPNKNPMDENHVTLFYLGDFSIVGEDLFTDILELPDQFSVQVSGYGYDNKNQGIAVVSKEFDFTNPHMYGNRKAVPHITYSWDEKAGGKPVDTGKLVFEPIHDLEGTEIRLKVKAVSLSGEMIPIQYYVDRSKGLVPPIPADRYNDFSEHDQNNPYHCYDLRMHTIKVTEYVKSNCIQHGISPEYRHPLTIAAQWHDIGKIYTKSVDEDGYNIYPEHALVSADLFDKEYYGDNKQFISFLIRQHDAFLHYNINDLTEDLIYSVKQRIQEETPFKITDDQWRALAFLSEADESAKNPVVKINGKIVRTMEDDIDKCRYLASKI